MLRLFVAIRFPAAIRERLHGLTGGVPAARWTEPDDLHLTLRFIGEADEGCAADIDAALTQAPCAPFELTLDGVGLFGPPAKPRVLWVGVAPCPPLVLLQGRVEAAAQRAGVAAETRHFAPHVTLARLGRGAAGPRLGRFLTDRSLFRAGPIPVTGFSLMRSHGGGDGPRYAELRRYGASDAAMYPADAAMHWTTESENG